MNLELADSTAAGIDWPFELARHERWLRAALWARLRDVEAIDEVWQEVAVAAIRQAAPLVDPRKVAAWLHRVAVRQALIYRRRMGRHRRLGRPTGLDDNLWLDPRGRDGLGWLLAEERQQLVRRALGQLGSRDAEILLLKYAENWTYQQIAEHLGIRPSAVESRLHRARGRMRALLASYESVESGTRT